MIERELARLVGRRCSWTPNMSDEVRVCARIADAVLAPTDEILVLVIPESGRGGTWVLGDEVLLDGVRLAETEALRRAIDWAAAYDRAGGPYAGDGSEREFSASPLR